MLGGEVGAVQAPGTGELVCLLQRVRVLLALIRVEQELPFHVHAGEVIEVETEPVLRDLHHEAVVRERLGTQQAERPRDLAAPLVDAPRLHRPRDARLTAHAHQRDLRQAHLGGLQQRQRVRRVGVTRPGGREHTLTVGDDGRLCVPHALLGELRRARAVDLAGGEPPGQQGGHGAAVLSLHQLLGVRRAAQNDVAVLPDDLLGTARPAEQQLVDLRLPLAEPRARAGADVASLVAVRAPVRSLRLELDGNVVLVAEHVERAGNDTRGAPGAQTGRDHLAVEVSPLGLVGRGGHRRAVYRPAVTRRMSPRTRTR